MSKEAGSAAAEQAARALMRKGLSDDEIARRTGLSLIALLELRAAAAVEGRRPPPQDPAESSRN